MLSNIKDIDSLLNHLNAIEVKQIETLKIKSSKFADNFLIIKRLYENENKSIYFNEKWLRISKFNLQLWISRHFKNLDEYNDEII